MAGGNFCAGFDLKELSRVKKDDEKLQEIREPVEYELGYMVSLFFSAVFNVGLLVGCWNPTALDSDFC